MMKKAVLFAVALALGAAPAWAGAKGSLTGSYVEARTAEVFTGGCIMNSEADQLGKQAIMVWRVDRGTYNGVDVAGLTVMAIVAGDRNLGMHEMGGESPIVVKSALVVEDRATAAQRDALVAFAREMSNGLLRDVVEVKSAPIAFASSDHQVKVSTTGAKLAVTKHVEHDASCGAMQWFHPLSSVEKAAIGQTNENSYSGDALGNRWSDPNKRSAFFGTFSY
jgi:hypothetical protein